MSDSSVASAALSGLSIVAVGALARTVRQQSSVRSASTRLLQPADGDGHGAPGTLLGRVLATVAPGADPERVATAMMLGGAIALGCLAVAAPVGTAVLAVVLAGLGATGRRWLRGRPTSSGVYEANLLSCLSSVQAALSSGASLAQALAAGARSGGPCATDLAALDRNVRAGERVQGALDAWAAVRPASGVPLVADALAIAGSTGASQVAAVEAVATTLRRRQAQAREVRALASQARASAVVLVGLPLGFAVLVSLLDQRVGAFLTTTVTGWACLIGGVALDAAGAAWMAALVRRVR